MPAAAVPLVLLAYLVGTVPTASWVAAASGHDPTTEGSGNPGASNVTRLVGRRAGAVVLAGDQGKGHGAPHPGLAGGGHGQARASGLAVVAGPNLPGTPPGHGGKGVATAFGAVVVLWPPVALVLLVTWLLAVGITRRASVGSLAGAVACPLALAWLGAGTVDTVAAASLALAIVLRHRDNLVRLTRGEEPALTHGR
jgi:glycerol-3-phosphate acyltransferase PlsY